MLHPSHTWATWPIPGLWTTCSALQGWATAADGRQGHTGTFLWGRQGHFVGQAAMQAESPSSYTALNWGGASRPTLCRHTEKPKPGRICEMSALYETDIWQEGKYPPRQKKDLPLWGPALQRCDTGHLFICTWVPTSPELGRLSMLNPFFGSGIPGPAALQSNLLSLGTHKQDSDDSYNHNTIDGGNKQTNS